MTFKSFDLIARDVKGSRWMMIEKMKKVWNEKKKKISVDLVRTRQNQTIHEIFIVNQNDHKPLLSPKSLGLDRNFFHEQNATLSLTNQKLETISFSRPNSLAGSFGTPDVEYQDHFTFFICLNYVAYRTFPDTSTFSFCKTCKLAFGTIILILNGFGWKKPVTCLCNEISCPCGIPEGFGYH